MWRWLSGIPRALRHHLHGPRASASGVCKEDELDEAKKCAESRRQQYKAQYRLGAGTNHQESSHDDNQWQQESGTDKEKGYRHTPNFWTLFCGPGSCEAFGWGTIVVVGLQLTRYHLLIDRWEKSKDKDKHSQCLLFKISSVLPQPCLCKKSILETNETPPSDGKRTSPVPDLYERYGPLLNFSTQDTKDVAVKKDAGVVEEEKDKTTRGSSFDPLETVMKEFETVCRTYAAVGQNIAGLKKALAGQLTEAANHWAEASSSAYGKASFNLGLCYETGRGVKKNMKQAVKLYERAVKENHPQAMYNLALLYLGEEEGLTSPKYGLQLMEKAAELGLAQAQTYMGVHIMGQKQSCLDKAVAYFRAAAGQDDSDGEYFLALCYEQGLGVEENKCRAADLYSQAATKGHDGAIYNLAFFHEHGLGGLPEDQVTAMTLYRKAANAGNESALYRLEGPRRPTFPNWKEQYMYDFVEEPQLEVRVPMSIQEKPPAVKVQPVVQVPSSFSSPSLTDYVRKHLEDLDVKNDVLQLDVASMSVLEPKFGKSKKPAFRKDKVFFTLGASDSSEAGGPFWADIDDMWEENVINDKTHFSALLQRNNTMPDVRSVTCS
ncbi:death ligand signal enhancer-like [Mizuhopecten yessoensis]|uniref:Death ligand signal enhancer n=1 Tax=Mizuhopecten yessoensis TaxID=6573 RepID=A0A210QZ53_MIZYE|nr:death ligand signal enhancer-like [Mizuhopecten yessoensis]OWF53911.1 Death ligand signal enhancer [Mizuhopecten yessoensis]